VRSGAPVVARRGGGARRDGRRVRLGDLGELPVRGSVAGGRALVVGGPARLRGPAAVGRAGGARVVGVRGVQRGGGVRSGRVAGRRRGAVRGARGAVVATDPITG